MKKYLFISVLFVLFFKGLTLNAQIDYISFEAETDDISSYLVRFRSRYHTGTDAAGYFPMSDTLKYIFQWQFGDGNTGNRPEIMHRYSLAGTYEVSLTVTDRSNIDGPVFTETKGVTVAESFEVPNVFTPDDDGNNDSFIVRSNGFTPLSINIFDRAGNIVYRQNSPVINWDGRTPDGVRVRPGVYYYVISSSDQFYNKKGFVHVFYNRNR